MVADMTADHLPPGRNTPARPLLDAAALGEYARRPGHLWRQISVAERTGSTSADLVAQAREGAPEGLVLVAEEQVAGRGRMGRAWVSPPRAALTFSVLLRPDGVPPARLGWLPLLAGVATAGALHQVSGLDARLKWPNDVLVGPGKLAGILAEASGGAVVVGIGLNVSTAQDELPGPGPSAPGPGALAATSLLLEGAASLDRDLLLRRVLDELERWYLAWRSAASPGDPAGSGLRSEYLRLCSTIGREVRVELPAGQVIEGTAADVDADGRLVVSGPGGRAAVGAGDVRHVR
jgi:BirA family transcriptional regulator, biotin operon repressor / biotin---[acetyl-CoA-carboxylase] ligase